MRRYYILAALMVLIGGAAVLHARAIADAMPMQPPGPARLAKADAVVIGRVVAHEPKDIQIAPAPGAGNVTYRVAVVNVSEALRGAKDAKSVRIAFIPRGDKEPIRPRPGFGAPQLNTGMEGMFFLTKHHAEKDLYVVQGPFDVVVKGENDRGFEKEVGEAKRAAKVLAKPMDSLKSKDAEERFLTASLLVAQYRNARGNAKTEAIPAEESKLILQAILDGKWNPQGRFGGEDAWQVFNALGVTEKDGWKLPPNARNITDFHDAAKAWLRKNVDSYRIQRFVSAN